MIDLKAMFVRDLLPITKVDYANISPLSIIIQGENYDQATQVLINDIASPEFIAVSSSRIIAQVPDSERSSILQKLAVLAEKPSITRSSVLGFEIGASIKGISGLERLVQYFCKLLLQTPGSDKFNLEDGGGLLAAVGMTISRHEARPMQTLISSAVNRTRDQILAKQSKNSRIPSDERLLIAKTEAVGFHPDTTTVSARVSLVAVSGRQAVANLSF